MADRPAPSRTLTLAQARLAWSHRQRLGEGADGREVPGGWMRALGGVDPYLSMFARGAATRRGEIDAAIADGRLWVVPGVRGCIWLVPREDVSLALRVGDAEYRPRNTRELSRLGVDADELKTLGDAVIEALAAGPMNPDALRDALPHGTWRSLGEEGKKLGHTTTLPSALRRLEGEGRIRRIQDGGGLDTQRYLWALAEEDLTTLGPSPADPKRQAIALAERFFRWAGPATLSEFMAWSSLGKKVSEDAIKALDLTPVEITGLGEAAWITPGAAGELDEIRDDDTFYFLPAFDNLLALRGAPSTLAAPAHHQRPILGMQARGTMALAEARWMNQSIVVRRGEWVGLWAWHLEDQRVIFKCFDARDKPAQAASERAAASLTTFIREELAGSPRANGIESERNQRARMTFVQEMEEGVAARVPRDDRRRPIR